MGRSPQRMVRAELGVGWKEVGKKGIGRVRGRNGPASKLVPSDLSPSGTLRSSLPGYTLEEGVIPRC